MVSNKQRRGKYVGNSTFSSLGTNAFTMGRSNWPCAKKSCACASTRIRGTDLLLSRKLYTLLHVSARSSHLLHSATRFGTKQSSSTLCYTFRHEALIFYTLLHVSARSSHLQSTVYITFIIFSFTSGLFTDQSLLYINVILHIYLTYNILNIQRTKIPLYVNTRKTAFSSRNIEGNIVKKTN
jgi:hypothetical protein